MEISIDLNLTRGEVEALKNFVEKSEAATSSFKLFTGRKLFNGEDIDKSLAGAEIEFRAKNKIGALAYGLSLKDNLTFNIHFKLDECILKKLVDQSIQDIDDALMIMMIIKRVFNRRESFDKELRDLGGETNREINSTLKYEDGSIKTVND